MEEEFKLYRTVPVALRMFWFPLGIALLGLGLCVVLYLDGTLLRPGKQLWSMLIWLASLAVWVKYWVRMPTSIAIRETGMIVFKGFWLNLEIDSRSIRSIVPSPSQPGRLVLRHSSGALFLWSQFEGFHRFITRLKELNPSVVLRGC